MYLMTLEKRRDLFYERPDIVEKLIRRLQFYHNSSVKVTYPSGTSKWNPPRLKGVILPWM